MSFELSKILQYFSNTEGRIFQFETLKSGHINDTFLVKPADSRGASFILQQLNTAIFDRPESIARNVELVANHLKSKGYAKQILQFCRTTDGNFYYQNAGNACWRLMPFIENAFSILKVENENQARTAAAAFGEYARFLSDLDTAKLETIIPNFHNADFRIQQFRDSLKKDDPSVFRFKKAESALDFIEKRLPFFENKNLNLPQRATHNDTKISNILFDKKTAAATCIIDLDTLQSGEILSDFGDMVRTYTPQYDEDFDADLSLVEMRFSYFEALAEGFLSEIGNVLTDSERKNLVFGAKRTVFVQALRFLTDYLNGDIYYKTERPDHNLARTRNQIALLKSIEKQADRMETTVAEIFISNKIKQ